MNWHQYIRASVEGSFLALLAAGFLFTVFAFHYQKKLAARIVLHYRDAVERQCGFSSGNYGTLPEMQRIMANLDVILASRDVVPGEVSEILRVVRRNRRIWYTVFFTMIALVLLNIYLANT